MSDAAYASAEAIVLDCLDGFLPPLRQTVADWALANRWLNNAGGGYVGKWTHDLTPYLVEPMACLTRLEHLTVALVGPGQAAKTVGAENWLGYSIDADPADMLWYMQSDEAVEAYVKGRINPLVEDHDCLRSRQGLRSVDDSLHFKRFRGMKVEFLSATMRALINKSAPRIVADEIDAYQFLLDVKSLLDVRRQTFGRQSKLLAMSHPDLARGLDPAKDWTAGIMSIYADSDRRLWWWPCPHCGAWSSPAPIASRVMTLEYPEDAPLDVIEREAHLVCPSNGCIVEDKERKAMNLAAFAAPHGGWIGEGQEISEGGEVSGELVARDTAGFWIVGAMSPFVLGGIGGLARAMVKAEREYEQSGEDGSLRQVTVKQWGWPYAKRRGVGTVEAAELVERAEPRLSLKFVPEGVRFLVAAVDIQAAHFEYLVRGFGVNGESWIVDTGRVLANPATSAEDWDQLLELYAGAYPLADGSGRMMPVRAMGYDSAGLPGVTQQAYAAWTRWRRDRIVRAFGRIGGRDAWSIIPLKGASGINAPRLQVTYPDTARKANVMASAGTVPVGAFNPNVFKDDLNGQLKAAEPGDWYVHFPAALKSKEPPHLFFEQLVAERQLPNGRWEKIDVNGRNEALDLMVMSHVTAHLHGLSRIDWEKPPSWAAPWPENTALIAGEVPEPEPEPDPAPSVTVARTPFAAPPKPIAPARRSLADLLPK